MRLGGREFERKIVGPFERHQTVDRIERKRRFVLGEDRDMILGIGLGRSNGIRRSYHRLRNRR